MSRESIRRAVRTFLQTFVALVVPGLLGFLNAITDWAQAEGQAPFPDGRGLVYVVIAALVAGVVAVVNLAWNAIEDAAGKGLLREVPNRPADH